MARTPETGEKPTPPTEGTAAARRKRAKRTIPEGVVHIHSTFNNTIISISDAQGAVIAWASAGSVGIGNSLAGAASLPAIWCFTVASVAASAELSAPISTMRLPSATWTRGEL